MKPTLLLHVGTHKTGTTSIQSFLAENRAWYADQGVLYPDGSTSFPRSRTPHHQFAHGLIGTDREAEQTSLDYVEEIKSRVASTSASSVIISAEPLYRHVQGREKLEDLEIHDYWQRREAYLYRLATVFQDFNIRVLLVLRRQEQFVESLHLTRGEKGKRLPPFDTFLARAKPMTDYLGQLRLLEKIFGDVLVLSYHRLASSGDLVHEFLDRAGLPTQRAEKSVWLRRTPDPRLVQWMAKMTSRGHDVGKLRAFIASKSASELLGDGKTSPWKNELQRDAFMRNFVVDNEALEKRFADPKQRPFFPEPKLFPSGSSRLTEPLRLALDHRYEQWLSASACYASKPEAFGSSNARG